MMNRRIYLTVWLLTISLFAFGAGQVWIADNNLAAPVGSHIFPDLPAAVSAAAPGDTILVKGSRAPYTNIIIGKQLVIIGDGFVGTEPSAIAQITITMDASGTVVYGMQVTDRISLVDDGTAHLLGNITIAYNHIKSIVYAPIDTDDFLQNLTVRSNIIGSGLTSNTIALALGAQANSNINIENNVFYGSSYSTPPPSLSAHGAFITRNVFLGTGTEASFNLIVNCSVQYNIFLGRSPGAVDGSSSGNSFLSNIAWETSDDEFAGLASIGSGSLNQAIDPAFAALVASAAWDETLYNLDYEAGSPAAGGDIGPNPSSFLLDGSWLPQLVLVEGVTDVREGLDLTLTVEAEISDGVHDVPTLSSFEYFFLQDPGLGAGVSAAASLSGNTYSGPLTITTSTMVPGQYTMFLRVRDDERWGHYRRYPVTILENSLFAGNITSMEYFFDEDPGPGMATDIPLSPANSINLTDVTLTHSLTLGFHNLFLRVQDEFGQWGLAESRLIYVDQAGTPGAAVVDYIEYFFDEDPGYGLANPITVSSPGANVELTELITTESLSLGFHNLFIRIREEGGKWSIPVSKLVYLDQSGVTTVNEISSIEYFFDEDPGYGLASSIPVPTPNDTLDLTDVISTDGVSLGFHNLFMRVQDDGGTWSLPMSELVYVDPASTQVVQNIEAIEYFFDEDPGYGLASSIPVPTPEDTLDISDVVSTEGLSLGFHNLFLRVKNAEGTWSLPRSTLVYIDPSGGVEVADLATLEYFFDTDPGYGNGTPILFTPGIAVEFTEMVSTEGLATGFHMLGIRAANENGSWGLSQSSLVYVDAANSGIQAQIEEMEYFFDEDPGFGLATSIPVTSAETVTESFLVAASALAAGEHTLGIRARSTGGSWGITENVNFFTLPLSRELDSLSLVVFYNNAGGEGWSNSSNWMTGSLDSWYGVRLNNGRVDSLLLGQNELEGIIPQQVGLISELRFLDLSLNVLKDTVPDSFVDLANLVTLKIHDNQLNELPDLSPLNLLEAVSLDSNYFDFGDIEPLAAVPQLTYTNQKLFNDFAQDSTVKVGQAFQFFKTIGGSNNQYQWYLNDTPIDFAEVKDFEIPGFTPSDTGTYVLKVSNSLFTELELVSSAYRLQISPFEEDSLALVSLYSATNGEFWGNNLNWLGGPLATWTGVQIENQRVVGLDLQSNNLEGKIPPDLSYADALISLNFHDNYISDTIPSSFTDILSLQSVNLSLNTIRKIPDFTAMPSLSLLDLSVNRLQFADIETNLGVAGFSYQDQQPFSDPQAHELPLLGSQLFSFDVSGSGNNYQWLKNGVPLDGETADQLEINPVTFGSEGEYVLEVTSDIVTDLTLMSSPLEVTVTDNIVPEGYSISNVLVSNETDEINFSIDGGELDAAFNYTIGSSGGGTAIDGNGVVDQDPQEIGPLSMAGLNEGTLTIGVFLTDSVNNVGEVVQATALLDRTPPFVSINSSLTNENSPALAGTVNDPLATIAVTVNSGTFAAVNNGDGTWTLAEGTIAPVLSDGTYDVVATATDPAGNQGTDSSSNELRVDTVPPNVTVASVQTVGVSPALSGTVEAGAAIVVSVNEVNYNPAVVESTWSLAAGTLTGLGVGTYDVKATATDPAGNVGVDNTTGELVILSQNPVALAATNVSYLSFTANWEASPGVTGYQLDVASDPGFTSLLNGFSALSTSETSIAVTGVNYGRRYYYRVRLVFAADQLSENSNSIEVKTLIDPSTVADSLALLRIYDSMGGTGWTKANNWKTNQPLQSWIGVTMAGTRVSKVDLSASNLVGAFPALSGTELNSLTSLLLNNNQLTSISSATNLTALEQLDLSSNHLDFGSLELFSSVPNYQYAPQGTVLNTIEVLVERGEPVTLDRSAGGSANVYQWFKNNEAIAGANGATYEIVFPTFEEEGNYHVTITSNVLEGLTLQTNPITFKVSSLERDKLVLSALYNATDGDNWVNGDNWNTDDVATWHGITVTDNRVTAILLAANGLKGDVPSELGDLRKVTAIDLSGNQLTSLPDLSKITDLTTLKVGNNLLQFDALEPNVNISGFEYAIQGKFGVALDSLQPVHQPFFLNMSVGGSANQYQWYRQGVEVAGAGASSLSIDALNYDNMGEYELRVTSTIVPDLTLISAFQKIRATAQVGGIITDGASGPVGDASGALLGVRTGKYDTTAHYTSDANGNFSIPAVVLGDYVLYASQNPDVYIPTYYKSSIDWAEAEVISLRDNSTGIDISMEGVPVELTPDDGDNEISGILDEDVADGRVLARRRVKGAGVTMSRQRARGKGTDEDFVYELVAYTQTDENGEFAIVNLPDGIYRLNIQYPGVPMDPDSFVEFEIGGGASVEENKISVNALVTPTGIVVTKVLETGIYLDYFKHLQVFPNPADKFIHIQYEKLVKEQVTAELLDLNGKVLLRSLLKDKKNGFQQLEVVGLRNGIYVLRFFDELAPANPIITYRIIISR